MDLYNKHDTRPHNGTTPEPRQKTPTTSGKGRKVVLQRRTASNLLPATNDELEELKAQFLESLGDQIPNLPLHEIFEHCRHHMLSGAEFEGLKVLCRLLQSPDLSVDHLGVVARAYKVLFEANRLERNKSTANLSVQLGIAPKSGIGGYVNRDITDDSIE